MNSETFHCECKSKNYCTCTKDCICNPSTCIHENGKYVKGIAVTLLSICNEIIDAMGNVWTNVIDAMPANMKNTNVTSVNTCH